MHLNWELLQRENIRQALVSSHCTSSQVELSENNEPVLPSMKVACSKWVGDILIMVFPRETPQPDDVCTRRVLCYMLEGGRQQALEVLQWFEDSLRLLDGNCYHFEP